MACSSCARYGYSSMSKTCLSSLARVDVIQQLLEAGERRHGSAWHCVLKHFFGEAGKVFPLGCFQSRKINRFFPLAKLTDQSGFSYSPHGVRFGQEDMLKSGWLVGVYGHFFEIVMVPMADETKAPLFQRCTMVAPEFPAFVVIFSSPVAVPLPERR